MGFSRKEYWSGLPFPSQGDLPDPGIEAGSSALQVDSSPSEPPKTVFHVEPSIWGGGVKSDWSQGPGSQGASRVSQCPERPWVPPAPLPAPGHPLLQGGKAPGKTGKQANFLAQPASLLSCLPDRPCPTPETPRRIFSEERSKYFRDGAHRPVDITGPGARLTDPRLVTAAGTGGPEATLGAGSPRAQPAQETGAEPRQGSDFRSPGEQ